MTDGVEVEVDEGEPEEPVLPVMAGGSVDVTNVVIVDREPSGDVTVTRDDVGGCVVDEDDDVVGVEVGVLLVEEEDEDEVEESELVVGGREMLLLLEVEESLLVAVVGMLLAVELEAEEPSVADGVG
jgi:hypothetical protein